jgi:hypothetical protein
MHVEVSVDRAAFWCRVDLDSDIHYDTQERSCSMTSCLTTDAHSFSDNLLELVILFTAPMEDLA